jgi:hypothetical protein
VAKIAVTKFGDGEALPLLFQQSVVRLVRKDFGVWVMELTGRCELRNVYLGGRF